MGPSGLSVLALHQVLIQPSTAPTTKELRTSASNAAGRSPLLWLLQKKMRRLTLITLFCSQVSGGESKDKMHGRTCLTRYQAWASKSSVSVGLSVPSARTTASIINGRSGPAQCGNGLALGRIGTRTAARPTT